MRSTHDHGKKKCPAAHTCLKQGDPKKKDFMENDAASKNSGNNASSAKKNNTLYLSHSLRVSSHTLWLFNIAMENGPFIDGLPIKNGDFP